MERLARKEDAAEGMKSIPLGRWGTVREIADATVYLFSEAAGYVNGTTLVGELAYSPSPSPLFGKSAKVACGSSQCFLAVVSLPCSTRSLSQDPWDSSLPIQRQ